ncbi:lycopene epsilon cyclase, chloroplastic [Cryptomeria japonica]|uniref:lycopene epsilon cyclase, chloroplastic n=1 Tax=Cryptomeria japonica TaxID=3369 RepID=UPI0025AC52B3|nr:lycopene epsilon cyclase, chloroplastic [Cryptomeria japonica]
MALDGFVQSKCKGIGLRDGDGISVCGGRGKCHSSSITCGWPSSNRKLCLATVKARAVVTPAHTNIKVEDEEDFIKAGGSEIQYAQMQATKTTDQPNIADKLQLLQLGDENLDLVVMGCGPAGMSLAAESAKQGLNVGLIGPDMPFTNNYGVWEDEFEALGLKNCIEHVWRDTAVYLKNDKPLLIGRAYGRVSRRLLREELLRRCAEAGVRYLNSKVEKIIETSESNSLISCENGIMIPCRIVAVASGAASGRFLQYDLDGPPVGVQTAYGMEVEVESFPYDPELMVFMDYRDYMNQKNTQCDSNLPTFLYAMPLSQTRVFFEETCLASRPAMPFEPLKKRLQERLKSMGVRVLHLYEEEWSYIPVGGSLPNTRQKHLGFGAAASMVHPATGYSVVRSLSEAPSYAAAIASALKNSVGNEATMFYQKCTTDAALRAWETLWPQERKRQRAFFLFGLELILQLNIDGTRMFFETFFQLPEWMWKGFLGARLSSIDLIWFALVMFIMAPNYMRYCLVKHLMSDPSGAKLIRTYVGI